MHPHPPTQKKIKTKNGPRHTENKIMGCLNIKNRERSENKWKVVKNGHCN